MLAIWPLVPLLFLHPTWTSGSSQFMYCWSLAWESRDLWKQVWGCIVSEEIKFEKHLWNTESHEEKRYFNCFYLLIICFPRTVISFWLMFKLVLEKAEEPEIKLPTSAGSSKKQESSRKTSISAFFTMTKPLTVWITINCGKFWKRWEYQTTWTASWETYMQVRKQQLEIDMEPQTGPK